MKVLYIICIDPGGGSTKLGLFKENELIEKTVINHQNPGKFDLTKELETRWDDILKFFQENRWLSYKINAVAGRGAVFYPLKGGTYIVDEYMINDIMDNKLQANHPANLGPILADRLAKKLGVKAYTVDPPSIDEMEPKAKISGLADIKRVSLTHALNIRSTAKKAALVLDKSFSSLNLIVVHIGSGISIAAIKGGRLTDVNDSTSEGPFGPQRAGGLPSRTLAKLIKEKPKTDWDNFLMKGGGLLGFLGTDSLEKIEDMISNGDKKAETILEAMSYQISKGIGAYAACIGRCPDAIVITGGGAYCSIVVELVKNQIEWMSDKFIVIPGENELEALAMGVVEVLKQGKKVLIYKNEVRYD